MTPRRLRSHLLRAIGSLGIALAAALLAVSTESSAQTLLIGLVGILCIFAPPASRVPAALLCLSVLLSAVALMAFLPSASSESAFREGFLLRGFRLPPTNSVQPWFTLEDLTLILVTLLWAWNCLESRLAAEPREFLLTFFLLILAFIAVTTLFPEKVAKVWPLLSHAGQFSNRNQTADLLTLGGVSSAVVARSRFGRRRRSAWFWLFLTGVFLAASLHNGSRAGIFFLVLGLLWAFRDSGRPRLLANSRMAVLALAFMAGVTFLAGGVLKDRIVASFLDRDPRLLTYEDATAFLVHAPWHGVGLGNFEGVFNTVRDASLHLDARNLHPESDWFWTGAELGWLGLVIVFVFVVLAYRLFPTASIGGIPGRCAQLATVLFLAHTFIDVGAHRMGDFWTVLYVIGLGVQVDRSFVAWQLPPLFFRAGGLALVALAALRLQALGLSPWMPIRGTLDAMDSLLATSSDPGRKKQVLDRAVRWAPLEVNLYIQRGLVLLQQRQLVESQTDFRRALYLDQSTLHLPLAIGTAWRPIDFETTLWAWREVLARAGSRQVEMFRNFYLDSDLSDRQRLELTDLAGNNPNLRVVAVIYQGPDQFDWLRENLLANDPDLRDVEPSLVAQFLDKWAQAGEADQFLAAMASHADWEALAWKPHARLLARVGRYKIALQVALAHLSAPEFSGSRASLAELLKNHWLNPLDPWFALQAAQAELAAGNFPEAVRILQQPIPSLALPSTWHYVLAQALMGLGKDEEAWNALEPLLRG